MNRGAFETSDSVSAVVSKLSLSVDGNGPPPFFEMVVEAIRHDADALCELIQYHQFYSWSAGDQTELLSYRPHAADVFDSETHLLEAIYADATLRQSFGQVVTLDVYLETFPQIEPRLRRLWSLHQSIARIDPAETMVAAEAASAPVPQLPVIPDHNITEVIGRGGMGIVFRGRDLKLSRDVAVKMILGGGLASPDLIERHDREAKTVARLRHPNIIAVHNSGVVTEAPYTNSAYFTMEFAAGETLRQFADRTQPDCQTAAQLVLTLARAMQYAHGEGVVHRDLKPANIQVEPNGNLKIMDFGLARSLNADIRATRTGHVMGTPAYMSPEQAAGRTAENGKATDIYALGVILYELLTQRLPIQPKAAVNFIQDVQTIIPKSARLYNTMVSKDLDTICLKCLQKRPEDRFLSMQALADDLERYLRGEAVTARPIGPIQRTARWCRKNPGPLAVGLMLAVAVVVSTYFAHRAQLGEQAADERAVELQRSQLVLKDRNETISQVSSELRRKLYTANIQSAAGYLRDGRQIPALNKLIECLPNPDDANTLPPDEPNDLRGIEWDILWSQTSGPYRMRYLSATRFGTRLSSIRISPRNAHAALPGAGVVEIWDYERGLLVGQVPGRLPVFNSLGTRLLCLVGSDLVNYRVGDWVEMFRLPGFSKAKQNSVRPVTGGIAYLMVDPKPDSQEADYHVRLVNWYEDELKISATTPVCAGGPRAVAVRSDGRQIVVGGSFSSLHIYDRVAPDQAAPADVNADDSTGPDSTWKRTTIPTEFRTVEVCYSPDDQHLVVTPLGYTAPVLKTADWTRVAEFSSGRHAWRVGRFSPNGKLLALTGFDGQLRLITTDTWAILSKGKTGLTSIWSGGWSPTSERFLVGGVTGLSGAGEGAASGTPCLRVLESRNEFEPYDGTPLLGKSLPACQMATHATIAELSTRGQWVVFGNEVGTIGRVHTTTDEVQTHNLGILTNSNERPNTIRALVSLNDGNRTVALRNENACIVHDWTTQQTHRTPLPFRPNHLVRHSVDESDAVSGQHVMFLGHRRGAIADTETAPALVRDFGLPLNAVKFASKANRAAISDGIAIAVLDSKGGTLWLNSLPTGESTQRLAMSGDGQSVVAVCGVKLIRVSAEKAVEFGRLPFPIRHIELTDHDRRLMIIGAANDLAVLNASNGEMLTSVRLANGVTSLAADELGRRLIFTSGVRTYGWTTMTYFAAPDERSLVDQFANRADVDELFGVQSKVVRRLVQLPQYPRESSLASKAPTSSRNSPLADLLLQQTVGEIDQTMQQFRERNTDERNMRRSLANARATLEGLPESPTRDSILERLDALQKPYEVDDPARRSSLSGVRLVNQNSPEPVNLNVPWRICPWKVPGYTFAMAGMHNGQIASASDNGQLLLRRTGRDGQMRSEARIHDTFSPAASRLETAKSGSVFVSVKGRYLPGKGHDPKGPFGVYESPAKTPEAATLIIPAIGDLRDHAVSPDGNHIVAIHPDSKAIVYQRQTNQRFVQIGECPFLCGAVEFHSETNGAPTWLFASDQDSLQLCSWSHIDEKATTICEVPEFNTENVALVFSPHSHLAVISNRQGRLLGVDTQKSSIVFDRDGKGITQNVFLSDDGTSLVSRNWKRILIWPDIHDDSAFVISVASNSRTFLSPDGAEFGFITDDDQLGIVVLSELSKALKNQPEKATRITNFRSQVAVAP